MAAGNPGPVVPQRYIQALGGADPLVSMRGAPARVAKLIRGLSEKQLSKNPAPGKWSIKEIISHLADGEIILGSRIRFIGAHDRPAIPGYDQDAFVERLGAQRARGADLLEEFVHARATTVSLLKRLPRESYSRVGLHSERGDESIEALFHMYAGHDRIHEEQIETLRLALFPVGSRRKKKPAAPAKKKTAASRRRG